MTRPMICGFVLAPDRSNNREKNPDWYSNPSHASAGIRGLGKSDPACTRPTGLSAFDKDVDTKGLKLLSLLRELLFVDGRPIQVDL